jgi:HTH-type transcriptional repressor of NAD biosynthesis genes
MPPHFGHLYMIDTALALSEHVFLLVYTMEKEPLNGFLRYEALHQHYLSTPNITVVWIEKDLPQYPEEHPDFWKIWKEELILRAGEDIDCVFGSEEYVKTLSNLLDCKHYIVDIERTIVPTSGTACRADYFKEWENIIPEFRRYLVKKVAILGGESTGKSTLTKLLATAFKTNYVEEYGREHCTIKDPRDFTSKDFTVISKTQDHLVSDAIKNSNKYLFCDTETVITQSFHQMMLGELSVDLGERILRENYDFYFVLAPSIPFFQDGTRLFPDHGQDHFQLIINLLTLYNKSFHVIYEPDLTRRIGLIKKYIENS